MIRKSSKKRHSSESDGEAEKKKTKRKEKKQEATTDDEKKLVVQLPINPAVHTESGLKVKKDSSDDKGDKKSKKSTIQSLLIDNATPKNDSDLKRLLKQSQNREQKLIEELRNMKLNADNYIYQNPVHVPDFISIEDGKTIICAQTNVRCWNDTHTFTTMPWFLPIDYYKGQFYVFGYFCSPECAMKYNIDLKDDKVFVRAKFLNQMVSVMFNKDIVIKPAKGREELIDYTGKLTIEQLRKNSLALQHTQISQIPPITYVTHLLDNVVKPELFS